jgi:iron complex transport system ATP-binding protein
MDQIRAEKVSFRYSQKVVLNDVSLSIERGEIVSLLGPNGSGKTTLLKVLLGLTRPERGDVYLQGEPVSSMAPHHLARRIAYVPQSHRTAFAYKVLDVVLMGRMAHKPLFARFGREDRETALHALEKLSIAHLGERIYTEISGGERQLTLIARAMAQGVDTLVMDEPATGLDFGNQVRLFAHIARLAEDGFTCIQSTHFPDHAFWIASRVVMLHEGTIMADGRPEEVMVDEAVCKLYGTDLRVHRIDGRLRTCVPSWAMQENHDESLLPRVSSGRV